MQRLMTTNEIGRLVGVSERTVANWIDRGYLPAFRTPGGHRRVDPKVLTGFLVERGIPVPESLDTRPLVLIVEDDVQVAETLRSYLEQPEGRFNVHVIHDGVSALIHIGNKKPQLVLLDVVMPGMDGLEVAKKIRANPELGGHEGPFRDRASRPRFRRNHAGNRRLRVPREAGPPGRARRGREHGPVQAAPRAGRRAPWPLKLACPPASTARLRGGPAFLAVDLQEAVADLLELGDDLVEVGDRPGQRLVLGGDRLKRFLEAVHHGHEVEDVVRDRLQLSRITVPPACFSSCVAPDIIRALFLPGRSIMGRPG